MSKMLFLSMTRWTNDKGFFSYILYHKKTGLWKGIFDFYQVTSRNFERDEVEMMTHCLQFFWYGTELTKRGLNDSVKSRSIFIVQFFLDIMKRSCYCPPFAFYDIQYNSTDVFINKTWIVVQQLLCTEHSIW